MRHLLLAGTGLLGILACASLPDVAAADTEALDVAASSAPQTTEHGVIQYPPAFFDSYNPNSALDMVNRVPGFSINDGSGSRGFEGSVGNILINGQRPASKNDAGSSVLGRTLAKQVERIELIRGGAPGIEMQGHAVVVNVILKNIASTEHILSHNSFLYDGGRHLFGGSYQVTHRKGDYTYGLSLSDGISSSDSFGEGPYRRFSPDGTVLRDEAYNSEGGGGSTSARGTFSGPVLGGTINLTARYGVSDWENNSQQTATNLLRDNRSSNEGDFGEVGLTYSRQISERLKSETRLIHEFEEVDSIDRANSTINGVVSPEQLFSANMRSSESIVRSLVRYQKSDKLEYETGGELAYNMLETDQAYSVGGNNIPLPSASVKVEEVRGELFGKGTWRFHPQWTLEAGLRLEHSTISQSGDADNEDSFFFAKPRVQLTWSPRASTQIQMRIEREVGQLSFGDFAASSELATEHVLGGNINLSPEQRWVAEVSAEQRFWSEGVIGIAYRYDAISDAIDLIPLEDGLAAVGNIGDGTRHQLRLNLTLPTDKLFIKGGKLSFSNTWNHTEVTDPTTGLIRAVSNERPSNAEISFEQNLPSLKLTWGADYLPHIRQMSYQPDQVSGWEGRDYYVLWAEYKPTPSLSIRAQVNVWDSFYWQREAYSDRTTRAIAFTEVRDIAPRPFYQLRVRKTF